ncbi:cobalt-precorrin-5B (C(1))-methyltransferase CbiD [Natranaerofaba carboxydovora]|uniref:cobalt-precorrin-5B (C(1))-methyltransferase CbiD n=1 Tax=Natranaerofaba carboxydovora TaxID=2742683 RepID=UPI001F1454DC|nr:cobalt-precorrin-5B (C(1))-methyltransferase CbiD [Natranaerofaba carboxydovora]UMZ73140.1 Energy-coupling factor transporter ATP-binding protein EcfA3 [Natranaerofaba carboxydovora]
MELELKKISYTYPGNIQALKDINLTIGKGKFYGLLGVNGSGKSTLLNIISRLTPLKKASDGNILLNGRELNDYKDEELYSIIGMVFQNPEDQLFVNNVLEDVAFGPLNSGLSPEEAKSKANKALGQVGALDLKNRSIDQLSFGQKKRVALAGVLAMDPELLLLDEPTAGLDPMTASNLLKLFKRLNKERQITIFMATQDVDLIPLAADELIILQEGEVKKQGPLKDVINPKTKNTLRKAGLRLPRISHLYEIIQSEQGLESTLPLTIGQAKDELLKENAKIKKFYSESPKAKKTPEKKSGNLKKGFTTGSTACAAAKGALYSLINHKCPGEVQIKTLNGQNLKIDIACSSIAPPSRDNTFHCGVRKDGGDDPDVTHNLMIMAEVELTYKTGEVEIEGGHGVGTVTKPGLPAKKGDAAINPGPKKMIEDNLKEILPLDNGAKVTIWVPGGDKIAKKTLNEKLGIMDGISILGTTGIVEPMSTEAYRDSLYMQLHQIKAQNLSTAVFTPGKIGENNAKAINIPEENIVFIGNFVGYMLSSATEILDDDSDILLFGHIGKLSKIAAGIYQTHSRMADARKEVFITHSALNGASQKLIERLYHSNTTEEMLSFLKDDDEGNNDTDTGKILNSIAEKITANCEELVKNDLNVGAILTDRSGNILAASQKAKTICEKEGWKWDK